MKNKKAKHKFSIASTLIYILIVLVVVMAYMMFAFPALSLKIAQNDAKAQVLALQVSMLEPYRQETDNLVKREQEIIDQYEKDESLLLPIKFSDIAYKAADETGVVIRSLTIGQEEKIVMQQRYPALQYAADIVGDYTTKEQITNFMKNLESQAGAGMYVESINYVLPDLETTGLVNLRVVMTTIKKDDEKIEIPQDKQEGENADASSNSNS